MKRLILTTIMLCCTAFLFAQTSKTVHTGTAEKSTVSISDSDYAYSVTASFSENQINQARILLTKALGKPENSSEGLSIWSSGTTYTVILKPYQLLIDLDKHTANGSLIRTFAELGKDIQNLQTSSHPHHQALQN